jgi:tetratricopeptide (TPR) repeat protein
MEATSVSGAAGGPGGCMKVVASFPHGSQDLRSLPFARALALLWRLGETGTLHLRMLQLEKSIIIREGSPVFVTSNIAEESLGRCLVKRGDLAETQVYLAESQAVSSGRDFCDLLVEQKLLSPYDLFKAMRRCLGASVLDAFRWSDGTLEFDNAAPDIEGKVLLKVNPASLVLRGVVAHAPVDRIAADFAAGLNIVYRARPELLASEGSGLSFNTVETRLSHHLAEPFTVSALAARANVAEELALRFVYALCLLDKVAPADEVERELAAAAPAPSPAVAPTKRALNDEEKATIDEAFLKSKNQDYFELLGVERAVLYAHLKRAYLARVAAVSPMTFADRDLGDRAEYVEELFVAYARAFAILADPDLRATYVERQRLAAERRQQRAQAKPVNPFELKTDIFDAKTHIENGLRLLNANKAAQALSHFEFAIDCEPQNPAGFAHLGYCQFVTDPALNFEKAIKGLQHAIALDARYAEAYFLLGRVFEMRNDREAATRAYAHCLEQDADHKGAQASLNRLRGLMKK